MAEPIASGAPYGHFGEATYDKETAKWHFQRDGGTPERFRPLGKIRDAAPSSLVFHPSEKGLESQESAGRRRDKQAKALIQSFPELQPACNILSELARVSEAIEETTTHYDPSKGNLLAFGKIPDRLNRNPARVVAFPCGPTGSHVRVVRTQEQTRGWKDSKTAYISVPVFHGEEAIWEGPGASVQALSFAPSRDHGGSHLVVRLLAETLIFRPVLRKTASASSSRLDLNLLYRVPIGQTGGVPHSDLSFNTMHSNQYAIVDQLGTLSVRECKGTKAAASQESLKSNTFSELQQKQLQPMYDGWARLVWIGNPGSLIVCNRERLLLCDMVDATLKEFPRITTYLRSGLGWNFDIAVAPEYNDSVFVLTSDHVVIYRMDQRHPAGLNASVAACTKHYRDPNDSTMRLHVVQNVKNDVLIFVSSRVTAAILFYQIVMSKNGQICVSDPGEFELALGLQSRGGGILDFHVHLIEITTKQDEKPSRSTLSRYLDRPISFYSFTILHHDLSISQLLYYTDAEGSRLRVIPPYWEAQLPKSFTTIVDEDDNPSVHDDELFLNGVDPDHWLEPVTEFVQDHQTHVSLAAGAGWTVSYERSARQLDGGEDIHITDVLKVIDSAGIVIQHSQDGTPFQTFRELGQEEFTFQNAEEVTSALETLQVLDPGSQETHEESEHDIMQPTQSAKLLPQLTPIPCSFDLPALQDTAAVHESIVGDWISPFPEDFPELVKETQERWARQIVAEITLARHIIRPEPPPPGHPPTESQGRSQQESLPNRSPLPISSRTTPSLYFDASSQPQSHSAPSSTITTSSHPSTFSGPEIARLSKYTTITNPPPALPRSLAKTLSHWQLGTDPNTYDWTSTSRRFAREDEEDAQALLPEKERRRLQRRTERYIRRQRREAEVSRRVQVLSSQPVVETFSASQPDRDVLAGSSMVQSSQIAAASQVVAGRHGGRKPVRKKRKSGF